MSSVQIPDCDTQRGVGLSYVLIQAPPKDCVTTTVGFEILGGPLLQDQTLHFSQKILTVPIATNIQVSVFESD